MVRRVHSHANPCPGEGGEGGRHRANGFIMPSFRIKTPAFFQMRGATRRVPQDTVRALPLTPFLTLPSRCRTLDGVTVRPPVRVNAPRGGRERPRGPVKTRKKVPLARKLHSSREAVGAKNGRMSVRVSRERRSVVSRRERGSKPNYQNIVGRSYVNRIETRDARIDVRCARALISFNLTITSGEGNRRA